MEANERARTDRYHAAGLAVTTYFNPMVCTQYTSRYEEARQRGVLTRNALGEPYEYRYTGASQFFVGQVDFTHPDAFDYFGDLLDEAVGHGYDGWMEDFGEYTPLDAHGYDGSTGDAYHNKYVVGYHAAARAYARDRAPRPLARFNRSGWTGAAQHSQIVWGGDPSTSWGFDGLESAIMNGLTMGLSGVSLWGSDIGGFFALSEPQTTPELLARWLEFGFASGVMRTQANGFELQPQTRAQIFDSEMLPIWARYAKLRTQLYPYLSAAQSEYDANGMPLMRHLALAYPDDPLATARADEYLLGSDLLVAPVFRPDERERTLYLPAGRWIDWWRSITLDARGAPRLGAPRGPGRRAGRDAAGAARGAAAARAGGRGDPAARPVRRDARRLRRGCRGTPSRSQRAHAAACLAARPAHRVARRRPRAVGRRDRHLRRDLRGLGA